MENARFSYTIRPMLEGDTEALVTFLNNEEAAEGTIAGTTVEEFAAQGDGPRTYMLAFLAQGNGEEGPLIGQMEFAEAEAGKAVGLLHVHHSYRNRGVGTALYAEFTRLAAQRGVTTAIFPPGAYATCHREFLERRGYTLDQYYWMMRLAPEVPVEEPSVPALVTLRLFKPGQDEQLYTDIRNATFAENYDSEVRTLDEMTARTLMPHFHPENIVFAYHGTEIAGFCFTEVRPGETDGNGASLGRLQSVGVLPRYRSIGLGRALLLTGVSYLRRSVPVIELKVDGRNKPALQLYTSVGFRKHRGWVHLRRDFAPGELGPSKPLRF